MIRVSRIVDQKVARAVVWFRHTQQGHQSGGNCLQLDGDITLGNGRQGIGDGRSGSKPGSRVGGPEGQLSGPAKSVPMARCD